jgi:hypothetical protein
MYFNNVNMQMLACVFFLKGSQRDRYLARTCCPSAFALRQNVYGTTASSDERAAGLCLQLIAGVLRLM